MPLILLSSLLYGLIHPGSKWILDGGMTLLSFVVLFIGLRLIFQLPLVIFHKSYRIKSKNLLVYFIFFGIIGSALQVTEFYGISEGLPHPLLTMLVYSHPIWTLLLGKFINGNPISRNSLIKMSVALVGMITICGTGAEYFSGNLLLLLGPLSAGLLIALWICFSNKIRTISNDSLSISFYYDLFSFMTLLSLVSFSDKPVFTMALNYLSDINQFFKISSYALLIGFLPNYFFYKGQDKVSSFTCGLILLLEPVVSTLVSFLIWHDSLSWTFFPGALLIVLANIPDKFMRSIGFKVPLIIFKHSFYRSKWYLALIYSKFK